RSSDLQRDPIGATVVSVFDDDGRLTGRTAPDGGQSAICYDAQGYAVSNVDALGRIAVSEYDDSNRLVRVTEAANTGNARATAFVYDARHRRVAVTNALGLVTRMSYDACDRLVSTVAPDGVTVTNVYDARGLPTLTRTLDAAGNVVAETATTYDARGLAAQITSTDAGTALFGYDLAGNVTNAVDALGRSTCVWYDKRGQATNTLDALGYRKATAFTAAGRPAYGTDPLGRTTAFFWTPGGKPAATRFADGGIVTNEYDGADRLIATTDVRGDRVALGLDSIGRVTNRSGQAWQEQSWYDLSGCITTTVDAVSARTDVSFDQLDRQVCTRDALGCDWTTAYDAMDRIASKTDPRTRLRQYGYDAIGRRISVTHPSGRVEGFAHDALGRWTAFTNAEGHVYHMAYDAHGRLIAATNAAGEQVCRNFYDNVGNLTNRLDGAGNSTAYTYDLLNRLVRRESGVLGPASSFSYDAVGNLLAASNVTALCTFGYDTMNRLTASTSTVAGISFATHYRHDLGGLTTNLVYPGGLTLHRAYDTDGRLSSVSDWLGHTWTFSRDAAGKLTGAISPNGVVATNNYDAAGRLASWSIGTLAGRTITRDAAGIKTREEVTAGPLPLPSLNRRAVNTHDGADRIVSATVTDGTTNPPISETYLYDPNGALTNVIAGSDTIFSAVYNPLGQISSLRLCASVRDSSYDALGNRVHTSTNGVATLWVTDHADPLKRPMMDCASDGTPIGYYIWAPGQLLGVIDAASGALLCAHTDEYGSLIALTDSSGSRVFSASYGPYGEDWGSSGTNGTPFRWLGGHGVSHAGGSLYLTRHRAYDTALKRFLSPDPLGLDGGVNLYAYADGDPLSYIDPLGLCAGDGITAGSIGSAGVLERSGQVRHNYNTLVAQLRATGTYSSERDALRTFFNEPRNSTALSRGTAQMYRWEQGMNGVSRSLANPTATAPSINNAAAMSRWGGRGLIVVGAGLSVYDAATAPDPYRATVQNGSAIAVGAGGASAGAWAGAAVGSLFPGPGTAIGAVVGAIVGGVGGGVGGHALGTAAYDANYGPNSPWFP
ncbi:MAG: hypothetical protein PHR35_14210, partial [Kiritimatiellae bacterium]|nr:hypothetical protein [Kiritimatiellia bacterium]